MISIRKPTLNDATILTDLLDQLGYKMALPTLLENMQSYMEDPDRALLIAEKEGKVVGCIAIDIAQTFHRPEKHMRVVSLVVDRAHKRKGIGKLLLKEAEELAKQRGCWVIEVTSSIRRQREGTHDFYLNNGYLSEGQAYFLKLVKSVSDNETDLFRENFNKLNKKHSKLMQDLADL
jgi:N-acetylglutamate synthase-like GNAT family acetyltransferase